MRPHGQAHTPLTPSLPHDPLGLVLGRGEAKVSGCAPAEEVAQGEPRRPPTPPPTLQLQPPVTLPPTASLGERGYKDLNPTSTQSGELWP